MSASAITVRASPYHPKLKGGIVMGRNGIKKQFWLTKEQEDYLEVSARKACIPEVQLIRLLLKGYQPPPAPDKEFYDQMDALLKASGELAAVSRNADPESAAVIRNEAFALKEMRLALVRKYLAGERKELEWR